MTKRIIQERGCVYRQAKAELEKFLDQQRAEQAGFSAVQAPSAQWVGSIIGFIVETDGKIQPLLTAVSPDNLNPTAFQTVSAHG